MIDRYRLRHSARARNVSLRVTVQHGLEVVVPTGFNAARLPAMLEHKRAWIRAALERAEKQRVLAGYPVAWTLPREIRLPALGKTWRVTLRESAATWVKVRAHGPDTLLIHGRIGDEQACRAALARWLVREARLHLTPRLHTLGTQLGLSYRTVSIKRQRARWGSCSRRGAINLNARLLFLEPPLVNYVLIHELCHLKELNHSRRFWALVARHDVDYRANDRALRDAWRLVPWWA